MFRNNLLIFLRNIRAQKIPNIINLIGLSIGLACVIMIFCWIKYELSYDTFHKDPDKIYRVVRRYENPDGSVDFSPVTVLPLAKELQSSFPGIIGVTRFNDAFGELPVRNGDTKIFAKGAPADGEFFSMFNFPALYGNITSSFDISNSVVITESLSKKLFGVRNPVGQNIEFELWGRWNNFEVSAVIKDIPPNSNFDFEMLFPVNFLVSTGWDESNWLNGCVQTYILAAPGTQINDLAQKIAPVNREHHPKATAILTLQPLLKIHLHNLEGGGRITYIYIFSAIAFIILLISFINSINLTTAYSGKRMKEVGVKKVMGACRSQLKKQFLLESLGFSTFALLVSLYLVSLSIPLLNKLTGSYVTFHLLNISTAIFAGIAMLMGIATGIYPAVILSSHKLTTLIKGRIQKGNINGLSSSKGILVGLQFMASMVLIVGAITIHRQLSFIKNKNLGFNKEKIIHISIQSGFGDPAKQETLKQRLLTNPDILSVTACNSNFTSWQFTANENDISWEGKQPQDKIEMEVNAVDCDYLSTFGMEISEGRFFSKDFPADQSGAVVLNQAAVRALNIKNPVGQQFNYNGNRHIVGIVGDFNFTSLHQKVAPLILIIDPGRYHSLYIKARGDDMQGILEFIDRSVRQVIPDYLFAYNFLEDDLNKLYQLEQSAGSILLLFSVFAVIISCLGILGLITYITANRTKEIGIRKVNGARVSEILAMLNFDLLKWIVLAFLLACPVAWIVMHKWLENFAYRTSLSWWIFILAGTLIFFIAILTVTWQSWRAATRNPIEALRYE